MRKKVQQLTKFIGITALALLSSGVNAQAPYWEAWSASGPVFTAGRARNMIVDKTDASGNTLYVGSTSSGIFKSTNGGVEWAPLDDQGAIRNISYLAQGPDGTIYAGTGEGFLRTGQKAKALPGTGLYRLSTNTLVLVVSSTVVGNVINKVAVSPANAANIALSTNTGIWYSMDGGSSFTKQASLPTSTSTAFMGEDVKFDSQGILYCSIGATTGNTLTPESEVWKSASSDLSQPFTAITPTSSYLADKNYGRIELAIAPSNNNVIYASCANKNPDGKNASASSLKGLFVSYNGGTTWGLVLQGAPQLDPLSNGGTLASGDYAQALMVNPNNQHQLFFGGYQMYVFTRNVGSPGDSDASPIGTWTKLGNHYAVGTPLYLHENFHDVKIIPGNPTRFFFITDAGIFRSTDMNNIGQILPPSFQPFYKGLVTGQFNSVSIERFPVGANATSTVSGTKVNPYSGFIGGTGGSGMTYYSGTNTLVTKEVSYLAGDVYNTEFSKILPNAAFTTIGTGDMYRTSNVKSSVPGKLNVNKYTGVLSKVAPEPEEFLNNGVTTGSTFKLWEWYGQTPTNPDYIYFYNDSLRFQASLSSTVELSTKTSFSFATTRPNKFAVIDSVVIRTGTVALPVSGSGATSPAFNLGTALYMRPINKNLTLTNTLTTITGTSTTTGIDKWGPWGAEQPTITMNNVSLVDNITVSFSNAPFAAATGTNPSWYRVFATIYYKYGIGDTVSVTDNNISTKVNTYATTFTAPLSWRYNQSVPSYTIPVVALPAISNPTYNNQYTNAGASVSTTQTSLPITVKTIGAKSYTVFQFGDYALNGRTVTHTLSAQTDTNISTSSTAGYSFVLTPGNITTTVASTFTGSVTFSVSPLVTTSYTITQTGTTAITAITNSVINSSTYELLPGNIVQGTPNFTVAMPVGSNTTYTINGISSNTLTGPNTTTVFSTYPYKTVHTVGSTVVPFPAANPRVKIPTFISARLAVALNSGAITGGADAIVVSKNPLALNDPLSFVRVSQSGCLTDDANGNPTNNTINIPGKPTVIEWSKSGTELYYATDANRVYRVSHITDIQDLSPSSYNGKFFTDIFMYNQSSPHTPNTSSANPVSPYRTTLLGTFDATISSISVTNDDKNLVVTFNTAPTSTTGLVMFAGGDVRTGGITWTKKNAAPLDAPLATYCNLIEKDNNNVVLVGTDRGVFYSDNIISSGAGAATWQDVNSGITNAKEQLPKVQIFDIEQQVMEAWDCFNSGQIYIATNGRGIWTNAKFLEEHIVGTQEFEEKVSKGNNLSIYPNPAQNSFNVAFSGNSGENIEIQVLDLSGRLVKTESIGKVNGGDMVYSVDTQSMNQGIYIVNVNSDSGVKRVAKLVVSK